MLAKTAGADELTDHSVARGRRGVDPGDGTPPCARRRALHPLERQLHIAWRRTRLSASGPIVTVVVVGDGICRDEQPGETTSVLFSAASWRSVSCVPRPSPSVVIRFRADGSATSRLTRQGGRFHQRNHRRGTNVRAISVLGIGPCLRPGDAHAGDGRRRVHRVHPWWFEDCLSATTEDRRDRLTNCRRRGDYGNHHPPS